MNCEEFISKFNELLEKYIMDENLVLSNYDSNTLLNEMGVYNFDDYLNSYSEDDKKLINETLESAEILINFIRDFVLILNNAIDNITDYLELYLNREEDINEIVLEQMNINDISEITDRLSIEHNNLVENFDSAPYMKKKLKQIYEVLIENTIKYLDDDNNIKKSIINGNLEKILQRNRYFFKDITLNNISLKNISLAIDNNCYSLINYIPASLLLNIDNELLKKVVNHINFETLSLEKCKILATKFSFIELYKLRGDNFEKGDLDKFYAIYEYIDEDTLDFIIENDLVTYSIGLNKYIINNKEYVKRIISSDKPSIIGQLSEAILDDEILGIIEDELYIHRMDYNAIFEDYNAKYGKPFVSLTSSRIFNFFLTVADNSSQYLSLLKSIDKASLKKEHVLSCMLNGLSRNLLDNEMLKYSRTEENIIYAIEKGYKCSFKTRLASKEEVKIFIEHGQPEIVENVDFNLLDAELYKLALKKGLTPTTAPYLEDEELRKLIEYFITNKYYDILPFIWNYSLFKEVIDNYRGNLSYREYLESIGILELYLDKSLFKAKQIPKFLSDCYQDVVKEIYPDADAIFNYIKYCIERNQKVPITKKNVYEYFNAEGPTKKFCDKFLFNTKSLQNYFIQDIDYKRIYSDEPFIISYIDFFVDTLLDCNFFADIIKNKNDISSYFDKDGPNKELFIYMVEKSYTINQNFFKKMFNEKYNYKEKLKDNLEVVNYINFRINTATNNLDYFFLSENLENYFDKDGPTKNLFDYALTESSWFNAVYALDKYNYKKMYEYNPEILSYIEFRLINSSLKYYEIGKDIDKYFDKDGPTKNLFDYALKDFYWFSAIYLSDKFDYKKMYEDNPEILSYIEFRRENRSLDYSEIMNSIEKNFNENGPSNELYLYAITDELKKSGYNTFYNALNINNGLIKHFENNPSILSYIKFISVYGGIFSSFITKDNITYYFDENGYTNNLKFYFSENIPATRELLSTLAHNDMVLNNLTTQFVSIFERYIIDVYFSDLSNPEEMYRYFLDNIGPKLLFNLDNANLQKMLKYSKKELDSFFTLFDKETTIVDSNAVKDNFTTSYLTFKFKKEHENIVNVFTNINTIITHMSEEELNEYLNGSSITSENVSKLNEWLYRIIYELKYEKSDIDNLKKAVIECKNSRQDSLRSICRTYLEHYQKAFYEKEINMGLSELGISTTFDIEDAIKKLSKEYLQNINYFEFVEKALKLKQIVDYDNVSGFIDELKMTKGEYDILLSITDEQFDLIKYAIKNGVKPDDSVKRHFLIFKRFILQVSKYELVNELDVEKLSRLDVKKINQIELENIDMISILNEFDIDIFMNTVANDQKALEKLQKICKKYFLGRLPLTIGTNLESRYTIPFPGGINNIGLFITRFRQILSKKESYLRNNNKLSNQDNIWFTFMEIVNYISSINSETYEIKRLLGTSEYLDFVSNRTPNSGYGSRIEREDKLSYIVDYLYTLDSITIPSHDIIIESIDKSKKINFIVGNRTNPSNVCHGERTGACMRVGGVGEGLFLKCLTDKNWFHIRIEDPETHEYISRVSGFRNGNTVYLNQLRNAPTGSKYTNNDLQEYIKIYAEMLIEETKDSNYPVENVFINTGYAMSGFLGKYYCLGGVIQQEYNLNDVMHLKLSSGSDIWTDVRYSAVLLATTEEGKYSEFGYVGLKNGPDNTEIYSPVRDKIYGLEYIESEIPAHKFIEVDTSDLIEKINRVHAMKEKLLGKDYRYEISNVYIDEDCYIVDGYASSDWYVYIDNNNSMYTDYISEINQNGEIISYAQSSDAKEEMEYFKEILEKKYVLNSEVKHAI